MKKIIFLFVLLGFAASFRLKTGNTQYTNTYYSLLDNLAKAQLSLCAVIKASDLSTAAGIAGVKKSIAQARLRLKAADFWLRYLDPIEYKKINGPLPAEWENEVFEKYEKPYKREGAGLSLAELYLCNDRISKDSLTHLVQLSADALNAFRADSNTHQISTFDHFFFCNRLYLLNLAAIYTTGFECPDKKNVVPELRSMLSAVKEIYAAYNASYDHPLPPEYLQLYDKAISFANAQPADIESFDHFAFIKDYVNPLFAINQQMIAQSGAASASFNDFTLNNSCSSIFDKSLYAPQNTKGIYSLVKDENVLNEIKATGKLLFYDPILSGNNSRSCASCHKPKEYFTDTSFATSLQFDGVHRLPRNTPSLINVTYNHLLMLDGRHISLQNQGKDVTTNPVEMGGSEKDIVEKVMSCKEYRRAFDRFLKYTPGEKEVTLGHIVSAITYYYSDFSSYYSPFDSAMNQDRPLAGDAIRGFNLFMGKAQCATCHYVPQFNGVPPPYVSSEFEVIGVPADTAYTTLSTDSGRYKVNPAYETMDAFRTGTVRNAAHTHPYMHNGVFSTLGEVIDFYDAGGGQGKKLKVANQTLSPEPLHLTPAEKHDLIAFINSLNENVIFTVTPERLPLSSDKELNNRKVGGTY